MSATATAAAPAANTATIQQLRQHQVAAAQEPADQVVDLFSSRGFALAQRIAQAFSTSNAVPVAFRQWVEKKLPGGGIEYVENTNALGNCLVAIETARAVGMSITAVMQNANVIEGRLTWSGQYKIAAINASKRFTPLRFDVVNKGVIKATYKEKQGWNRENRRFDFKDITVEIENLECVAWALPGNMAFPPNVRTLADAKALKLPVIESAPVSMKLAVEEGWYGKAGSKWQTEMKHLMLQYRAGSFFGNIHAPDIVMGMGRTTEEMQDAVVIDLDQDSVRVTSTEDLRSVAASAAAEVTQKNGIDPEQEETAAAPAAAEATEAGAATSSATPADAKASGLDVDAFAEKLSASKDQDSLDAAMDSLRALNPTEEQRAVLSDVYQRRAAELDTPASAPPAPAAAPTSRRARGTTPSID
ncbi:hypothetical protein QMO14_17120 [Variovorax sp. CAN2819]|uniref:hypothetical protein n=1 Tax=Variovorax sp. CAN15 TaxID=3046727 RepID=UPI002649BB37|nr:hypothetical protein [Variovorax sp. CAN15]MDN6885330.1 hypothetical protein [Variovorax sp. CAN15]